MNNWLGEDHVLIVRGTPTCEPSQLDRVLEPLGLTAGIALDSLWSSTRSSRS
jgi:hypothetical protein